MMQKIRRIIIFISLFLFPLTFNYLSPYISLSAAFTGVVAGSVIVFALLFLSGMFLGRSWCGWCCPIAGLSEMGALINNRPVPAKKLAIIRYIIFAVWFAVLAVGFVLTGGIKGVEPFHMTEHLVSIDEPVKFINYYMVLAVLFVLTVAVGRRGACHSICWIAPFLTAGELAGLALHIPQVRILSVSSNCIDCKKCNSKCPMSIDVSGEIKSGTIKSLDCIRCGECADNCPRKIPRHGYTTRMISDRIPERMNKVAVKPSSD
jgi:polyferredoxin